MIVGLDRTLNIETLGYHMLFKNAALFAREVETPAWEL